MTKPSVEEEVVHTLGLLNGEGVSLRIMDDIYNRRPEIPGEEIMETLRRMITEGKLGTYLYVYDMRNPKH